MPLYVYSYLLTGFDRPVVTGLSGGNVFKMRGMIRGVLFNVFSVSLMNEAPFCDMEANLVMLEICFQVEHPVHTDVHVAFVAFATTELHYC